MTNIPMIEVFVTNDGGRMQFWYIASPELPPGYIAEFEIAWDAFQMTLHLHGMLTKVDWESVTQYLINTLELFSASTSSIVRVIKSTPDSVTYQITYNIYRPVVGDA